MTRRYTLRRRAERKAETRRRIVEATVDLHGKVGPAATTFSMVAERAGVQRHTLYAHFPNEKALFLACSGHHLERSPPPDPAPWRAIADEGERLRAALGDIYAWYASGEDLLSCVLRDAEHHAATREVTELRIGPVFAAWREALGLGDDDAGRAAMLELALSFHTWRTLARDGGLAPPDAAAAMAAAVVSAARSAR